MSGGIEIAGVKLGSFEGRINMMVIETYDFDIMLGNTLMNMAKVCVMPHLGGIMVMHEENPYFVEVILWVVN